MCGLIHIWSNLPTDACLHVVAGRVLWKADLYQAINMFICVVNRLTFEATLKWPLEELQITYYTIQLFVLLYGF